MQNEWFWILDLEWTSTESSDASGLILRNSCARTQSWRVERDWTSIKTTNSTISSCSSLILASFLSDLVFSLQMCISPHQTDMIKPLRWKVWQKTFFRLKPGSITIKVSDRRVIPQSYHRKARTNSKTTTTSAIINTLITTRELKVPWWRTRWIPRIHRTNTHLFPHPKKNKWKDMKKERRQGKNK